MKILITGGNGFIAKNLTEQLNRKYKLISVNKQKLDLLNSKDTFDYLRSNKFDVIIHTATYDAAPKHSTKDPTKVLENNLKMFFNITRCKKYFGKMIYFGSGAEYSREHWIPKMKEEYFDKNIPSDQYGFSKYVMTKHTLLNENIYNLRLFAVFGKYDDWRTRFIPNICCQSITKSDIEINQNAFYDYLYINDLVNITKWFIDNKPQKKVYNVCSGKVYERKKLAEKIVEISGKDLKIIIKNKEVGREYSGDNTQLLSELKEFEFTPINKSIKQLYEWYNQNRTWQNTNN